MRWFQFKTRPDLTDVDVGVGVGVDYEMFLGWTMWINLSIEATEFE